MAYTKYDGIFDTGEFDDAVFDMSGTDRHTALEQVNEDILKLLTDELPSGRSIELFKQVELTDEDGYDLGTTLSTTADETYIGAVRFTGEQDIKNYPHGHAEVGDANVNLYIAKDKRQPDEGDYLKIDGVPFEITSIVQRQHSYGGITFMKVFAKRRTDAQS